MPYLSQPDLGAAFPPFAMLERRLGFVPALFRAQTLLPRSLEAQMGIAEAVLFGLSPLPRLQKERILLAVAASLGNTYCVAAHHRLLLSLGEPAERVKDLGRLSGSADLPPQEKAMIDFSLRLAWLPTHVTAGHVQALCGAGVDDGQVMDVVLVTALTRFHCSLAAGLGVEPDFPPPAWHEPRPVPPSLGQLDVPEASEKPEGRFHPPARSTESFPPFQLFQRSFGFVPRIFRAQTSRPEVVEAEAEAVRLVLLTEDILSRVQKESILLAVSALNLNTYCVAVHCEILRALGVDEERSERIAVSHHEAGLSGQDVALLDFSLKLAGTPGSIGPQDVAALLQQGFTEPAVLEAVVMVSLTQFLNTLQMGLGVEPDFPPRRRFSPQPADFLKPAGPSAHPKDEDEDRPLVERARSGDLEAFEALVRRHDRRVYRTLIGVLATPEDAEDALQNVFLKVYAKIGSFRGESRFSTWLTRIAINEGLMKLRGKRTDESFEEVADHHESAVARDLQPWQDDPESLYSRAELLALVEKALGTLPAPYRLAVMLRDIEQLTTEEAAAAMSLPVATLKTRLFRGRLMLRDALAPHFQARGSAHA